jgi:quinol monooxygenase YgiN
MPGNREEDQLMSRISIVVEFTIKPGCFDAFNAHIRQHASATLAEEPGCERFEVMQPLDENGAPDTRKLLLVEVYTSMDAVRAHRANPRMPKVAEGSAPMLDGRQLTLCAMD